MEYILFIIWLLGWWITYLILACYLNIGESEEAETLGLILASAGWPILWGLLFFVLSIIALFYIGAKVAERAHKKIKDKIDKIFH